MSDYYMWLLDRVDARGAWSGYTKLLFQLYSTTYEYAFVMDMNRAKGGESLRSIYAMEYGLFTDDVYQGPCTVLEMLIRLADNLSYNTEGDAVTWFWRLISNLGLLVMTDEKYDENYISEKLNIWMNHEYGKNGDGSLFPLHNPIVDCRTMEIWDQMNAYILENYPVSNWMD